MSGIIVDVSYPYVYDLYYRVRHACLEYETYRLDFLDWVKAGIAYNVRGVEDPNRKVSYFGQLYSVIQQGDIERDLNIYKTAVVRFYEDIFQLYQDHLVSQLKAARTRNESGATEPSNLILLPSFKSMPKLYDFLPIIEIVYKEYVCQDRLDFQRHMSTIYAAESSDLFKMMSLVFDYGYRGKDGGVILEVK